MKNNEQHAIDMTVRQALENLEIPYNADHWQAMAGKLDALDAEDAQFDKDLATRLERVEMPYKADNWADMSARLDDLDNSETHFDALFSQRLENLQVKYQPNHWNMMADKIEQTFSWRAKIVRYKVVEVALVLLTLFTVGNMLDLPFDSDYTGENPTEMKLGGSGKAKKEDVKKASPQKLKETKPFYNPTNWRNRPASPNNTKSQDANGKPIVATDNVNGENLKNTIAGQLPTDMTGNAVMNTVVNNSVGNVEQAAVVALNVDVFPTEIAENTEGGTLAEISNKKVLAIGQVNDVNEDKQADALAIADELNPMDLLKPSLLNTRFYDDNVFSAKQVAKKSKWRLNLFGLPVADRVSTNYLVYRDRDTLKQNVPNLGAGLAVGYKKGRWEVDAGLSYLDKEYNLPNVEITTGSVLRGFKTEKPQNLHLSIVSIPLNVNYTVKDIRHWSFYTRIGAALNTILKSKEEKYVAITDSQSSSPAPQKVDVNAYEPNVYPKGILEKGFFKSGKWINGGLKENTYATVNAGIGVEYRLTNKTDIYLQPTFDYHFSKRGIGNLNDRIQSFSVQGGVKTKLK